MSTQDHLTTTFLRSHETESRYLEQRKRRVHDPKNNPPFEPRIDNAIREFDHWFIIENDFPYDAIATTHHLLFTKRKVAFEWDLLTQEEREELEYLKKEFFNNEYDVFYENLPKGQTLRSHFHLHLLILKRSQ